MVVGSFSHVSTEIQPKHGLAGARFKENPRRCLFHGASLRRAARGAGALTLHGRCESSKTQGESPWRALKEKGSTSLAGKTLLHECLEIRGASKCYTHANHICNRFHRHLALAPMENGDQVRRMPLASLQHSPYLSRGFLTVWLNGKLKA